jgi:hypothetical protein
MILRIHSQYLIDRYDLPPGSVEWVAFYRLQDENLYYKEYHVGSKEEIPEGFLERAKISLDELVGQHP